MPTIQELLSANNLITGALGLIIAVLWLVFAYVAGQIAYRVIKMILVRAKLDQFITEKEKLKQNFSEIFSLIAKWALYLYFVPLAASSLGIVSFTVLVDSIIAFLIGVIEGAIVLIVGYIIASYIKDKVISTKSIYGNLVGQIIFYLTVFVAVTLALPFFGLRSDIIQWMLLAIIGSFGVGMAIALGWGLKDVVAELAKDYVRKMKSR